MNRIILFFFAILFLTNCENQSGNVKTNEKQVNDLKQEVAISSVKVDDQPSVETNIENRKVDIIKLYEPLILEKDLDKKDYINEYARRDFSVVWRNPNNTEYLGFIGDNYQRIRIKIFSVVKDNKKPQTYTINGKSAINNEIKSFQGTFIIKHIKHLTNMHWGIDDEYKNKGIKAQGVLIGEYKLYQDRNLGSSGYFEGVLSALWYINKAGEIKFDNIQFEADPYRNNQFVGTWTSYDGMKKIKSNWGDYRIPDSGDLDGGAGEFSPIEKYKKMVGRLTLLETLNRL